MPSRPLVLAHRGAARRARENTIEAFARAAELGADGVELDVRRTADDVLVVHHDPAAIRTTAFAELRAAEPSIPTLAEALEACAGLLVNVEIKCLSWEPDADPDHEVVAAAVELLRGRHDDVVISSFELGAIDACRALAPALATGWLVHGRDPATAAAVARDHGHPWLHPDRARVAASLEAIAACHAQGVRVDVWTVDDPAEIRALAAAGVDAVITNEPDVARAALARPSPTERRS